MKKLAIGGGLVMAGIGAVAGAEIINDAFPNDRELTEKLAQVGECVVQLPPDAPIVINNSSAFGERCEDIINEYVDEVPAATLHEDITIPDKLVFQSHFTDEAINMRHRRDDTIQFGMLGGAVLGLVGFFGLQKFAHDSKA